MTSGYEVELSRTTLRYSKEACRFMGKNGKMGKELHLLCCIHFLLKRSLLCASYATLSAGTVVLHKNVRSIALTAALITDSI